MLPGGSGHCRLTEPRPCLRAVRERLEIARRCLKLLQCAMRESSDKARLFIMRAIMESAAHVLRGAATAVVKRERGDALMRGLLLEYRMVAKNP